MKTVAPQGGNEHIVRAGTDHGVHLVVKLFRIILKEI